MLKTCFTFLLTRLCLALKKNITQTQKPLKKTRTTEIFIMVWLRLKTGKSKIMANRIPNVPSWIFFGSEKGNKKK